MLARRDRRWIAIGLAWSALAGAIPSTGARALDTSSTSFDAGRLTLAAQSGDPAAAFQLGTLAYVGVGVVQDYLAAVRWLKQSAAAGNAEAACELGMLYQTGSYADGPPNDSARAAQWYSKAATAGSGCGALALGALYQAGDGVAKDPAKAAQFFNQAAASGYTVDKTTFPLEQLNRHFHAVAATVTGTTE